MCKVTTREFFALSGVSKDSDEEGKDESKDPQANEDDASKGYDLITAIVSEELGDTTVVHDSNMFPPPSKESSNESVVAWQPKLREREHILSFTVTFKYADFFNVDSLPYWVEQVFVKEEHRSAVNPTPDREANITLSAINLFHLD